MMRVAVGFTALAALLSGCGGGLTGDAKAVHDACTANGGEAAYCDCMVKTLQETLSPEAFANVAKGEDGGDLMGSLDAMDAADKTCKASPPS